MTLPHEFRSIGAIWPVGIPVSQSWADIGMLMQLVHEQRITFVFEVGAHRGGLTSLFLMRALVQRGFRYAGVEIDASLLDPSIPPDAVRIGDAWSQDMINVAHGMLLDSPGPCLILCDGGDKPKELRLYAPLLRSGDWIAAHDYGTEVKEADAQLPGLEPYRPEWVSLTHWVVLRKP